MFLDIIAKFANSSKIDNSLFEKQSARALYVSLHFAENLLICIN